MKKRKESEFFKRLEKGLQEGIQWTRGELELRTTLVTGPDPMPFLTAKDIRQLRSRLKMSQIIFAMALNVMPATIQNWEEGKRKPSYASARLLQVMKENPQIVCAAAGIPESKPESTRRMSKKSA